MGVYGPCIAQECGRFVAQLHEEHVDLIEEIAEDIYANYEFDAESSTIVNVDLASQKITFDTEVTKQIQTNNQFQELIEFMVDVVGHQIRKKVRHLFDLK